MRLAVKFQTWGFFNRECFSTMGLDGMGDAWGQLSVPYYYLGEMRSHWPKFAVKF